MLTAISLPFIFLFSAFYEPESSSALRNYSCLPLDSWVSADHKISAETPFVRLTVQKEGYLVYGYPIQNEREFRHYLTSLRRHNAEQQDLMPRLFLTSAKDVPCHRFNYAASIATTAYGCGKTILCIWAFGAGEHSFPRGAVQPRSRKQLHSGLP